MAASKKARKRSMPTRDRRAEDRSPAFRYRVARAVRDHPRITWGTLAAITSTLAVVAAGGSWLLAHLAMKSELVAHERHDATVDAYNSVKIDSLRVERLGDEVDQLKLKGQVIGRLAPLESAQLGLWQRKLDQAAAALVADQNAAKQTTKEDTRE